MLANVDALLLARWQFGFTVAFHIVFPAFSIGLASYLAVRVEPTDADPGYSREHPGSASVGSTRTGDDQD